MQSNEFDGNAAFSGGGFMPSQATQTAPDRPSSSSKNSDARCLLPLTVKQLMDLSRGGESDISIEGVDVNNIVLVGRVSKIDNAVSECTFRVDDGTGWVECTKWVHEHIDSVEVDAISVGMYVRVYGQLKSIHGRRTVHTFSIRLVTDYNEITNHFIECIYVHLYNTKMRGCINTQPRMTNSVGGMTAQPQVANSNFGNPGKGYSYETNQVNQYNNDEEQIHALSSTVLQFLRRPASISLHLRASFTQPLKITTNSLMPEIF
ncbi:replication protein A 32 kDa subunit B-like isoform X2 [Hibiscus syriacus]|uniref:replication protein A 32 kDa subunit B-like isoform X2 n=1 Tax=Hibiscus syriacus TaxID=106335 RepID=UPI00192043C2|nr:replication protein A 32 kDa subunit B-like isoform X2 [Hibiscus syriacus]XP_039005031.1 replication protein A 32 kDa subunit B-like isoform X2 [Hibiscus syriacus]